MMSNHRGRSRSRPARLEFSATDVGQAVSCAPTFKAKVDDWLKHPQHPTPERDISLDIIKRKLERAHKLRKTTLDARLADAADARNTHLRHIANDAHSRVQHAKQVAELNRAAEAALAKSRRRLSDARQAAAAARRDTRLRALSAVHGARSPDTFLRANAAFVERSRQLFALRRIQKSWRAHVQKSPPTATLARKFVETTVPGAFEPSLVKPTPTQDEEEMDTSDAGNHVIGGFGNGTGMPWQRDFDAMTALMQSPATLTATGNLLRRFSKLLPLMHGDAVPSCDAVLRALFPRAAANNTPIERYPTKLLLCAYMLKAHPNTLLNDNRWDSQLIATSEATLAAFEKLVACYYAPNSVDGTPRELLQRFDEAWGDFLDIFSTWRGTDAAALEADLTRMAVDMQASMLAAVGGRTADGNPQVDAIVAQVEHDQALLRARVARLSGQEGVQRFDAAVAAAEPSVAVRSPSVSPSRSESSMSRDSAAPTTPQRRVRFARNATSIPAARASSLPSNTSLGSQPSWTIPTSADGTAAQAPPQPTANEALFHQLLLDPAFQFPVATLEARWAALMASAGERVPMPSIEATASPAAVQQHIAMVAQDALVDAALAQLSSITDDASEGAIALAMRAAFGQMLAIISELAREVFATLPEVHPAHAERSAFEQDALEELLAGASTLPAAVVAVAGLLDKTVTLLLQVGAPSREAPAREATRRVTADLQAALAPSAAAPAAAPRAVAAVLTRALRLLLVQMHMLKADAANGRLTVLAASLTPSAAVAHATAAFANRFTLSATDPEEATLHTALPITAEFAASSPSADHVAALVQALRTAYANSAAPAVPTNLRAGRAAPNSAAPPPPGSLLAEPLLPTSCEVDSWAARFRCAVAALLVQPMDFTGNPAVPEVLQPYCSLLDEAKGMYQKSIVTAVCLQVAAARNPSMSLAAAVDLETRLSAVQATSADTLVTAAAEIIADAIPQAGNVIDTLRAALASGSAALQREAATVLHQLQALLLHGPCEGMNGAPGAFVPSTAPPLWAQALLQTPAMLSLHAKVGEVAHQLMRVVTVAEAAHAPFLSKLF